MLALAGCLAHPPPVKLAEATPIAVAYLRDEVGEPGVVEVPDELKRAVEKELAKRNLEPREIPFARFSDRFAAIRDSQRRLQDVAQLADAPLVLLVETSASFYSQLAGRFRWDVSAKLTAERRGEPQSALSGSVEHGAILLYDHEREDAAVADASRAVAHRAGSLLDTLLALPPPAAPARHAARAEPDRRAGGATAARRGFSGAVPEGDAIYFALVDRFADGDPSNDAGADRADPQAFHGGDLQGVLDHLDALKALGVETVWLSPVWKMRTEKFFGFGAFHGYWVEDFAKVEPRFGDEALLAKLSAELHRRGMRLVLDVVLNHVAPDHPWVKSRPSWFHGRGPIKDWNDPSQLVNGDVEGLPDLAQENPEVAKYLVDTSLAWIDRVHPDGFRLDAVKHVPLDFWARYDDAVHAHAGPGFELLGEDLDGDPVTLSKVMRAGHFDAMFDFPLHFAMVDVFCKGAPPARLAAILSEDRLYDDPGALVTLLDNHDLPRIATSCDGDLGKVSQALSFMAAARGTPSITYGTESALEGEKEPANRGDMRFDREPLRAQIAALLAARREHPSLLHGAQLLLRLDGEALVYARVAADEAAVVAVNAGAQGATVSLPDGLGTFALEPRATRVGFVRPKEKDGFAGLAERARREWRGEAGTRAVQLTARGAPAAEGDAVCVVGSGPELGDWKPERALALAGGAATAELPVGSAFEYKLAVRHKGGGVDWEPGANRALFVPEGKGPLEVKVAWRRTALRAGGSRALAEEYELPTR